jgi:hypothetical protein
MTSGNGARRAAAAVTAAAMAVAAAAAGEAPADDAMDRFEELLRGPWQVVLDDPGTDDWRRHWMLDGENARVECTPAGMELHAGPTAGEDADHAVLWTRASFAGDLKIEYEFTRLDDAVEFVVILYVQATGSGQGPYAEDIAAWNDLRRVPAMRTYFNHMHSYHISYAAFDHGNADPANDYIRARRYLPESGKGLEGTGLSPSYDRTGLFARGVPHRITVVKHGQDLYLHVRAPDKSMRCHWRNQDLPPILDGRVGLRHMYTRHARYRDIRVSVRNPAPTQPP